MNIYTYNVEGKRLNKLKAEDKEFEQEVLEAVLAGQAREFIAEEMFNSGYRKESAELAFCLVSIDGEGKKKKPTGKKKAPPPVEGDRA